MVSSVAEFWCSRVEWSSQDKLYHLKGVMPPDEYHSGVNNSVYTNVLVQNSLHFAAALAKDLGLPIPKQWLEVADRIKVPFDSELNFHPEFDGYERACYPFPQIRRRSEAGGCCAPGIPSPLSTES